MFTRMTFAAAAAVAVLAVLPAQAETLYFSYVSSQYTASWSQPSDPTPTNYGSGFTDLDVVSDPGSADSFTEISYYTLSQLGGFTPLNGTTAFLGDIGKQIFTGPESAPIFSAGTFGLDNGTLTVTVPEPSSWALAALGFAALGFLNRRTIRSRAPAAA